MYDAILQPIQIRNHELERPLHKLQLVLGWEETGVGGRATYVGEHGFLS
jgi:hypothetical protein